MSDSDSDSAEVTPVSVLLSEAAAFIGGQRVVLAGEQTPTGEHLLPEADLFASLLDSAEDHAVHAANLSILAAIVHEHRDGRERLPEPTIEHIRRSWQDIQWRGVGGLDRLQQLLHSLGVPDRPAPT